MKKILQSLGFAGLICAVLMAGHFAPDARVAHAQDTCDVANGVLVSTLSNGINCIDANGIHTFDIDISFAPSSVDDFAICPDSGNLVAVHIFGLAVFDGASWSEIEVPSDVFAANSVICDASGQIWIAHSGGVSVYDGSNWTNFSLDQFGTSSSIFEVSHIKAGSDGSIWATTGGSVAQFVEGGTWNVFETGTAGFDQDYISDLALTADNLPVVSYSSGVLTFDGTTWSSHETDMFGIDPVAIAPDGSIWVGSITEGVAKFDGSDWTLFDREAGLSSNTVNAIAVDSENRVWVGTEHGLSIFDGSTWTIFYQDNSGLLDNDVELVKTLGAPALPAFVQKAPGSVTGVIVIGRDGVPNARVELCTELMGGTFYGDTPCADHAGALLTTTNDAGEFSFENVPVGRYQISIEAPSGWVYFSDEVSVGEGGSNDLGFVDVGE